MQLGVVLCIFVLLLDFCSRWDCVGLLLLLIVINCVKDRFWTVFIIERWEEKKIQEESKWDLIKCDFRILQINKFQRGKLDWNLCFINAYFGRIIMSSLNLNERFNDLSILWKLIGGNRTTWSSFEALLDWMECLMR